MRNKGIIFHTIAILSLCSTFLHSPSTVRGQSNSNISAETVERWMVELSNWGRWGKDDQLGTINLITPAKRKQAAALVKDGTAISLSREANKRREIDNERPFEHVMVLPGPRRRTGFNSDIFTVFFHGWSHHTHLDGLAHMFHNGRLYNGFPQSDVTEKGAPKLGVSTLKDGIFTRGILMDIPRLKGLHYLEPGTPIFPDDLDTWLKKANLKTAPGDALFIRTGRWALRAERGPWDIRRNAPGLHVSCAKWLKQHDIAILASDAAGEIYPSGIPGVTAPIHQLAIIAMGMPLIDQCDLKELAAEAAKRQRWEFLLTAAPLAVPGATGSAMNPIAIF